MTRPETPQPEAPLWLRRHRNPWGLVLRAICGLGLGAALWAHALPGIALALALEAANWLAMPPRDRAPDWLERVIARERAWLRAGWSGRKAGLVLLLAAGAALLSIGLWRHDARLIASGLAALAVAGAVINLLAPRSD